MCSVPTSLFYALPALPAESVNLPFLGSRVTPHATFQYLLQDVSAEGVTFAVPRWVVNREHFEPGARINFHLPFRLGNRTQLEGEVISAEWDAGVDAQRCVARLSGQATLAYPVFASIETRSIVFNDEAGQPADPVELVRQLFHDLALLKRGTRVYFKHLVPLFSRITFFPTADFGELRKFVLNDIRSRITANIATLDEWKARVEEPDFGVAQLPQCIDLEALRVAVEAEINNELFAATFESPAIKPYLEAIRLLEHKAHLDYNTLVLLYAAAL